MTPLVTLDPLPTLDAQGADVTWRPLFLSTAQTIARSTAALVSRVSTEGGAQAVDCWYSGPGSPDAMGVDLEQFLRRPYFVGLYYLRVRTGKGETAYYRVAPTEGGDVNARAMDANIDARRIEALLSELAEERARAAKLVEENTNLRAHVNDALDREAKTRRELAEAQAMLAGAEEAANPMFGAEETGAILTMGDKMLRDWASGGEEGQAQALIGGYFTTDFHLAGRLAADVDVMTLVAQRFPLEWDAHAEAFNVVSATLAQAQGRDSAHVLPSAERVRLLLPAARESAREARALEVEEARRLVKKHTAKHTSNGRGGAAAAKRSGARANGARANGAAKRGARKERA